MRGQAPIIAMRRQGVTPASVWFTLHEKPVRGCVDWPTWTAFAFVDVQPGDNIARLDLRFAVGLVCWVDGPDAERVQAMTAALEAAGAKRVLWAVIEPRGEELQTVAMGDTEGHAVWRA